MRNFIGTGRRRWPATAVAMVATAALLTAGSVATASAATAAPDTLKVETHMYVVGFDKAIAAANGYTIQVGPDGKERSVRLGTSGVSPGGAEPAGEVTGDCGTSWVYETGIGNRSVALNTGFQLVRPVVDFNWIVYLDDPGGESDINYPSGSNNGRWQDIRTVYNLTPGPASAVVRGGGSNFAITNNGSVCYSGGVSGSTTIY